MNDLTAQVTAAADKMHDCLSSAHLFRLEAIEAQRTGRHEEDVVLREKAAKLEEKSARIDTALADLLDAGQRLMQAIERRSQYD